MSRGPVMVVGPKRHETCVRADGNRPQVLPRDNFWVASMVMGESRSTAESGCPKSGFAGCEGRFPTGPQSPRLNTDCGTLSSMLMSYDVVVLPREGNMWHAHACTYMQHGSVSHSKHVQWTLICFNFKRYVLLNIYIYICVLCMCIYIYTYTSFEV